MADLKQEQSDAGLKERFFRYFQHEVIALQEQIEQLAEKSATGGERTDGVDHCLAGIARLSHEVKDASSYIPAYDQRTYAEAIKALTEKLNTTRASFAPRTKFQFKGRATSAISHHKNPSAISITDAAELAAQQKPKAGSGGGGGGGGSEGASTTESSAFASPAPATPAEDETGEEDAFVNRNLTSAQRAESIMRQPSFSGTTSVAIAGHSNLHILVPAAASHATSSGSVGNLRHCVVDLSLPAAHGGPFAGLTVKHVKDSLVVCGRVAGPIHITGVRNAVLVVACRQFRMHECANVDVYLHCASRPIIEDCKNIRFAPIPAVYHPPSSSEEPNLWDQVDDFKWLRAEPSPHWSALAPASRVPDPVWRDMVPGGPGLGLDAILAAVGVGAAAKGVEGA
ncbi:uncharacterized protein K452DRAFT_325039 [Aplosporella prunicola CBS 121167]|uniref:C-CAP/cofactor C-like domain-containing protein n=1 Tax=Aplosporella prunicola CBS 121167 TaxID=1176127 RepID=A0A6A6BPH2_9PEZI|nr:uncharacterized protein K452DRAFT_325039 [Aplosporella prunicola CBS 121167]KAF2144451.1 hypothetical protein K452DRAFT_325039 [Aplosporella prunicola CBS 121167]